MRNCSTHLHAVVASPPAEPSVHSDLHASSLGNIIISHLVSCTKLRIRRPYSQPPAYLSMRWWRRLSRAVDGAPRKIDHCVAVPASARCLRWRPVVNAPPPFGLRRVLEGDCFAGGTSAARRRLRLISLCSRRYLEGQRIIRRA